MATISKIMLLLVTGIALTPGSVLAKVAATPDLSAFISAWKKSPAHPDVPKTLAIIDSWQNAGTAKMSPHFGALEPKDCAAWTYLQCEGHSSLNLAVAINTATPGTFKDISSVGKLIRPDIFVLPSNDGLQFQLRGHKEPIALKWIPNSEDSYARGLTDTVMKALGYDGIVLAQKGTFLLIGSTTDMLEKNDIEGLLLDNSENSANITDNTFTGSALVTKISNQNGFGLFSLLTASSRPAIAPGTKVILEKKRIARLKKELPSEDSPASSGKPAAIAPKL